ncbi:MAG: aminopeptidase [Clostridia bacterium]|nr:aminopeptidase [Clostridia bacterium]
MKKTLKRKYAKLLVKQGVNIQKGQQLNISADVEAAEFVALLVEEAYRAGAGYVRVDWSMTQTTKLAYRHCSMKTLCDVPDWQVERARHDSEILPARIALLSQDPDALASANPEKIARASIAASKKLKPFREAMENKHQWLVCAIPGKAWAKKVFPNDRASVAVEKLWEAILSTVNCNEENDCIAEWDKKNNDFKEKSEWLNSKNFDYLHYRSSNGTDFTCELMKESVWCGGGETTLGGVFFNPNMPTEEIFTTPKKGRCNGRLVSTMPLSVRGTLIDKFYIDFEDGKAVSWHAEKGNEALGKLITTDEGSAMLGELALVPKDSGIAESGLLYYNTLFDENASCHVAIGMGYSNCVKGFENMTLDELRELGVNDSMIHVDFMIGADDLTITGYKDGVATPVFVNGKWAE